MPQSSPRRIGVYGGGFDPVHNGHLRLARTARDVLPLDQVVFMPSGGQAHYKQESNIAGGDQRVEMLRLAIDDEPGLAVSAYEVEQGRFCYTYETLCHLRDHLPAGSEVVLLTGGDWKDKLHTWKYSEELLREFTVALFSRPGYEHETHLQPESPRRRIIYVDMTPIEASSSDIRRRIREGRPYAHLVPPAVKQYIEANQLYQAENRPA